MLKLCGWCKNKQTHKQNRELKKKKKKKRHRGGRRLRRGQIVWSMELGKLAPHIQNMNLDPFMPRAKVGSR